MSLFKKAVNEAMLMLADDPRTVFVGQGLVYGGIAMHASLDGVPMDRRIELPVVEDFQMGFCTGLALMGKVPVCMFPRFDFVLLAANQLVNHLDKLPGFGWHPKVIIRTAVGSTTPLDAGPQHTQDHAGAFRLMLHTISVLTCRTAEDITAAYTRAIQASGSIMIVENPRG
jgi:pyruvate/2-oxoglutarate/acetoin dehydrogenase E1 component